MRILFLLSPQRYQDCQATRSAKPQKQPVPPDSSVYALNILLSNTHLESRASTAQSRTCFDDLLAFSSVTCDPAWPYETGPRSGHAGSDTQKPAIGGPRAAKTVRPACSWEQNSLVAGRVVPVCLCHPGLLRCQK
jgi:hypothetical protein